MNIHTENAQITADKMIARAKEATWSTMAIEYRENGRVVGGSLRCHIKRSFTKSRTTWTLRNGLNSKTLTKAEVIALLAEHYQMTAEVPAGAKAPATDPVGDHIKAGIKPAFRRVFLANDDTYHGYAGDQFRARFWFESDALEWRAADPLNSGTIQELIDREEQRKES